MEGLFIRNGDLSVDKKGNGGLELLAKHGNIEVMCQYIKEGALVWLTPGVPGETFEYFFVHEGEIEITGDNCSEVLERGDCFFTGNLKKEVQIRCSKAAKLLYVSNSPIFDGEAYWQRTLQGLLLRIDQTDHYTLRHSRSVMKYAVAIHDKMSSWAHDIGTNDFVIGCLFHDVGKCNTPKEILQKPGRLTPEEYGIMKQHPLHSGDILEPMYGNKVATLARQHHERLDGTGYPLGLKEDQIPPEARILMVADAFDAISSRRVYQNARGYEDAVIELRRFPSQYDSRVVDVLEKLVKDGTVLYCSEHADE